MSVKIRLARFGKHKVPFYHIVATDSRNRRDSKFLEKLGTFNPLLDDDNEEKIVLKKDRVKYWLGVGAIPTERVAILLLKQKIEGAEKFKPSFTPVAKGVKSKSNKGKMPEETATSSTNEETTNNSQEEVKTE